MWIKTINTGSVNSNNVSMLGVSSNTTKMGKFRVIAKTVDGETHYLTDEINGEDAQNVYNSLLNKLQS